MAAPFLRLVDRPPPLLQFDDVWVEYGETVVLERLNLTVTPDSFVSIVGPPGAGKSALLRLVCGREAPSRGRLLMDGEALAPGPDRGMVFSNHAVFPHLTALDNVAFGADCAGAPLLGRMFGGRGRAARDAAREMLDAVGLSDAAQLYPGQMNPVMRQRLALAQAAVGRPRVLLMDDPFGALDSGGRMDLQDLLTDLWQARKLTVLMVTRDIREAFRLGTRVLALDKRRRDPQAPNRFGATAVYDFVLDRKSPLGVLSEMEAVQEMVGEPAMVF
jgi:NitT/TauT family transport system ATP-binding protein